MGNLIDVNSFTQSDCQIITYKIYTFYILKHFSAGGSEYYEERCSRKIQGIKKFKL